MGYRKGLLQVMEERLVGSKKPGAEMGEGLSMRVSGVIQSERFGMDTGKAGYGLGTLTEGATEAS